MAATRPPSISRTWRLSQGNCRLVGSGSWSSGRRRTRPSYVRTRSALATTNHSPRLSRCARRSTICAMRSTPLLTEAQPIDGHTVRVRFEDGTAAAVDLAYLLAYGGVFEPL